ncbi:hypothetical protein [Mycolicibacterium sp. CR10]|uniref:hypothetical protein n=1 Tax=Mycolicibacterium sp. CR10 TaxID=2562314 RepID=UPI0010C113C3|nr:hypothetical protein [Mycolicibacterium sp. CR10]
MTPHTRDLVQSFLDELSGLRLKDTAPPMHVVERRLLLAGMVLEEVGRDDLECLAVRALAEATTNLCWTPMDPDTVQDYVSARQAYLEVVQSV